MAKTVITGVDGDYGAYVAQSIQSKMNKEDLIFTSPIKEALESYGKLGIATVHADFTDPKMLPQAFVGGETLLLISFQSAFPFCSDDRVSLGRAIREDRLSYFTHDFQRLTGKFPLTVREIFKNIDRHLPVDRTA